MRARARSAISRANCIQRKHKSAMAEEGKKISFGFSKSIKKPVLKNVVPKEEKKIDYIECVDDKAIKIVGGEEKKDEPLVIPMLGSKTWHERIINKVDADIFEPKVTDPKIKDEPMPDVQVKQEKVDDIPNGIVPKPNDVLPTEVSEIKTEPVDDQSLTLEEQAAREIIADLNSDDNKNKKAKVFTLPITGNDDLQGKEEPTLDDYENIPIEEYGMAMLRGMGWQPGKGIGKNEKVVPPAIPELRPKGMGLGADKLVVQSLKGKGNNTEHEKLKLVTGACVKVTAGKHSGSYGKIVGFDEEAARLFLKLELVSEVLSVNECYVQPVTTTEYTQNSRVLNTKTYEGYKNDVVSKSGKPKGETSKSSEDDSEEDHRKKRSDKSKKKSKKRRSQSSDDEGSVDRRSRRKRDSSYSSEEEQKQKRSKKSKKHKSRDSSAERSSRKNKKKDKDREKSRQKKSEYSGSSEKSRHKNRRRSRSRSDSPRNLRRTRSPSVSPRNRRRDRSRS
ncbi:G-patch domain and KOW motifs-containing protein-like isoform X1 [Nasonia vitripennis]|uniref:G-patch domain-containing protein n=1 Tax=Nasonia vitripennis TaxID=7425 RepID=A0A7M7H5Z3_NASVI|nr:G-patch domain and KOW motifs-containing protein-like isoform X1 [Nasonia vitripennis]